MKSIVLTAIRELESREEPKPQLSNNNEVLLKIAAVGICGSDIHYFTDGRIGEQVIQYPSTIGHECSAIVEETGSEVTRVKIGDRVVVDPLISCGKCTQCLSGRRHTCLNGRFLGCPGQLGGCLSEYLVMPQKCCYPIPNELSLTEAVLIEPLSIALYAIQLCGNLSDKKIGILGVGPIGLSVLFRLQLAEVNSVFVTDKIDDRLAFAKRFGANWIGNPDKLDIVECIQTSGTFLLDAIFECCGDQAALDQAIELLKPGGSLLIIGIPKVDRVSFDIDKLRRKEIRIQNVRRQNNCIGEAIDLVVNHPDYRNSLITHRFAFEEAREAFSLVAGYQDGVVKAVIQVSNF